MARNKTERMTISFEQYDLIKELVEDIAKKENRSFSAIIERTVLQALLPNNPDAKWIVEHYLYSPHGGIGESLSAVFANNSTGINWKAVHDNMLPLVRFASTQEALFGIPLTGDEAELYHACSQIEAVIDRLQKRAKEVEEDEKKWGYTREAEWGNTLLKELKEFPRMSHLANFYQLLLHNWEDFKGWSVTYCLLCDLARLGKGWRNDMPEIRLELLQILKDVSGEW